MARKDKKQAQELQAWQTVEPVEFAPNLAVRSEAQSLLVAARQGQGFDVAGGQIAHAIDNRATHILMDFSQAACSMRYQIDGIWEQIDALDRETGDAMLYAIKQLCQLNPGDRRSQQSGACGFKLGRDKYQLKVQSQGVKTGERVLCQLVPNTPPFAKLAELGMRDKMIETFKAGLNAEGGLILITAPKGMGLTTTWTVAMNEADKFIRDFQAFEDENQKEPEIINVTANYYGSEAGVTEVEMVQKLVLREPDVLVFPELPEEESLKISLEQCAIANKHVIIRMNANSAVEAARVGQLSVALTECRYPTGNPSGDAFAYLRISDKSSTDEVFSGWMIASAPALNALDHARYDVWVIRCKTS